MDKQIDRSMDGWMDVWSMHMDVYSSTCLHICSHTSTKPGQTSRMEATGMQKVFVMKGILCRPYPLRFEMGIYIPGGSKQPEYIGPQRMQFLHILGAKGQVLLV